MKPSKILELREMVDEFSEDVPEQSRPVIGKTTSQHYGSFYLRIGAVGNMTGY